MGLFDWLVRESNSSEADVEITQSNTAPAPLIPAISETALKLGYTVDDSDQYFGFYLPAEDRTTHLYVLGSSGVGKSKGLANWILADINAERGCGVIDPHGDLVNDIVSNLTPKNTRF